MSHRSYPSDIIAICIFSNLNLELRFLNAVKRFTAFRILRG